MIDLEVHQNEKLIMQRTYYDSNLSLDIVIGLMEKYIINEQLNVSGECLLRARYTSKKEAYDAD